MRAAYIKRLGPADEIVYGELPDPLPTPGEVLVEVAAVAVNPVDVLIRAGRYRTPMTFPFVIGRDLVGRVVEVPRLHTPPRLDAPGPDLPGGDGSATGGHLAGPFAPGDWVWCDSLGHAGRQGSFADLAVVSTDRLYPLPAGADPVTTVAALHSMATAWLGLFRHARLHPGESVLIGGAAGGVGSAAVQLAAAAGARVVATAHPRDTGWCRSLGAAEVLDYRDYQLPPGSVDVFWDTYGAQDLALAARALRVGGRIVLAAAAQPTVELPLRAIYTKDITMVGFAISNASVPDLAGAAAAINERLAAGTLRVRVAQVLQLSQAARAHAWLESDERPSGKLVLRP